MHAIHLFSNNDFNREAIKECCQQTFTIIDKEDLILFDKQNKDNIIIISVSNESILDLYTEDEREYILNKYSHHTIFLIQFRSYDMLKLFMNCIHSLDCVVHNDNDKFLRPKEVISMKDYEQFLNSQ